MDGKEAEFKLKRAETKKKINKVSGVFNITLTLFGNLAFIIAIAIVLGIDDGDCDQPIRQWLIVWAVVNGFLIIIYLFTQCKCINEKFRKFLYNFTFLPGGLFNLAWMIVGSVWEYTSDNCNDDFYNGWALTLALLIVMYVGIGLACCIVCCACFCLGGVLLGAGLKQGNTEEQLAQMEKELVNQMKALEQNQAGLMVQYEAEVKKEKELEEQKQLEENNEGKVHKHKHKHRHRETKGEEGDKEDIEENQA